MLVASSTNPVCNNTWYSFDTSFIEVKSIVWGLVPRKAVLHTPLTDTLGHSQVVTESPVAPCEDILISTLWALHISFAVRYLHGSLSYHYLQYNIASVFVFGIITQISNNEGKWDGPGEPCSWSVAAWIQSVRFERIFDLMWLDLLTMLPKVLHMLTHVRSLVILDNFHAAPSFEGTHQEWMLC